MRYWILPLAVFFLVSLAGPFTLLRPLTRCHWSGSRWHRCFTRVKPSWLNRVLPGLVCAGAAYCIIITTGPASLKAPLVLSCVIAGRLAVGSEIITQFFTAHPIRPTVALHRRLIDPVRFLRTDRQNRDYFAARSRALDATREDDCLDVTDPLGGFFYDYAPDEVLLALLAEARTPEERASTKDMLHGRLRNHRRVEQIVAALKLCELVNPYLTPTDVWVSDLRRLSPENVERVVSEAGTTLPKVVRKRVEHFCAHRRGVQIAPSLALV